MNKLLSISNSKYFEYFILIARFLLAITFINYGYSKLTGGQFGVTPEVMATPLKEVSFFNLMWYLFDQEPLKSFVGIFQMLCGLFLLYNRTVIIGVFFFIPIAANILLMDITFMPKSLSIGFTRRFVWYFILCGLILFHYRSQMKEMWNAIVTKMPTKFKFPLWWLIFVPVLAFILEFFPAIPLLIIELITNPKEMLDYFTSILQKLV